MATLLTGAETDKKASISRSLRHKLIKDGLFPQPIRIGARRIAFIESEVDEWITSRIASSRNTVQRGAV